MAIAIVPGSFLYKYSSHRTPRLSSQFPSHFLSLLLQTSLKSSCSIKSSSLAKHRLLCVRVAVAALCC
ncbi:hypothetical protein BDA96_01G317900 [Sorghum bicolor]|uniref:Uncharacterized protein n=1 Tax=Sorghum bicolor TaxID=4558 RepID=A0A921S2D2_SORBI|nr:hypothetical protein BDA96_01G317900 [Sorghum bicolor]